MPNNPIIGGRPAITSQLPYLYGTPQYKPKVTTPMGTGAVWPGPTTPPRLNTSAPVPSTALTSPATPSDVTSRLSQLQGIKDTALKIQSMIQGTSNPTFTADPLQNPESAILKFPSFEQPPQTEAQQAEQTVLGSIRDKAKEFFGGREQRIADTNKQYGIAELEEPLAETRNAIAQRQVQLRERLKDLETKSVERGIPREAAIDLRNRINSDAYFDLSNLALIETAQLGNLTQAKADAKAEIDEQYASYEAFIAQQQAELDYLKPTLTADQKKQADIAQFQLDQYKEQLQTVRDEKQSIKDLAIDIAGQGAPTSIVQSILSDPNMTYDRAIGIATPYIGLLDRQNQLSIIADRNASSAINIPNTAGGDNTLSQLFNIANLKGGIQSRQKNESLFTQYVTSGNIEAAEKLVNSMVVNSLPVAQQNDFKQMGAIITMRERLRKKELKLQQTNPNLFTTALNSALPFAAISKDKDWLSFVAETQSTINQYRNNIFGASLTGNELKAANLSLPNWDRDTFSDIVVKLDALDAYARNNRDSMIIDSTGQFTDVTSLGYGESPDVITNQTTTPEDDIFLNELGVKDTSGYWNNLRGESVGFFKSLFGY
jgi:uncharacterized coiled-coil protein SlyX